MQRRRLKQEKVASHEEENEMIEATKTWELGTLLGLTTPARGKTIKAIAEIRRSVRLASKSKGVDL